MISVFYDTWAFLALLNRRDAHHALARHGRESLERLHAQAVTSSDVLDETLTALHALAGAQVALGFLDDFEAQIEGGDFLLAHITRERSESTFARFRRMAPRVPRLSLTDCSSFEVMEELDIRYAFTADRHFTQAGRSVRPLFIRTGETLRWVEPVVSV